MDFSKFDVEDSLIITASRRQSRFIREQYSQFQLEQGLEVWQSIKVLPWTAFINHCWDLAMQMNMSLPSRLSSAQGQYLWQNIVNESDVTQSLLNSKQTQKLSYDAWRVCQQWQIETLSYLQGDQDQIAFDGWFKQYQKLLHDHDWIDSYQQPNFLLKYLSTLIDYLPKNIICYGFQQPTPQQTGYFEALNVFDNIDYSLVKTHKKTELKSNYHFLSFSDPTLELVAAVRWAREKINTFALQKNEDKKIAIVVPELEKWKATIERIIDREFYVKNLMEGKESSNKLHDFSIDELLIQQPMVSVIVNWLMLICGGVQKEQAQQLLLSPYLYDQQEQHWQASKLELLIKQSNKDFYTLEQLGAMASRMAIQLPWLTSAAVVADSAKSSITSTQQDFTSHITHILKILSELHSSGYHSLTSREYQVQQRFIESLKSAQNLQKVLPAKLNFKQAVKQLLEYLQQQTFHQQQDKAPLQIMGLLEAIGINFDAVWVVGMTDQALPQKAVANPFISKALHLKHQLPGSSHKRELDYADSVLNSLLNNQELNLSFAEFDGEQQQMISPLLKNLVNEHGLEKVEITSPLPEIIDQLWSTGELEYYQDDKGLSIENDIEVRGGTGLLRMQASSPFDAYLRYRLQLQPFETDDLGVSFMERGNLFHKVMQIIWRQLQAQETLLALTQDSQEKMVDQGVDAVLLEARHQIHLLHNSGFYQNEKQRLSALVNESLELDKKREPFKVIGTEEVRKLSLSGLTFTLIIDRIDQLDDGSLLIIDYKTGRPSLVSLFKQPIAEPQLLLYAISEQTEAAPVAGIVFMQAHLKESKYIGITEQQDLLDGAKALKDIKYNPYADDFKSAIAEWTLMLEKIAEDFKKGKAQLTDYSGDYSDHLSISRWSQRDKNLQELIIKKNDYKKGALN